MILSNSANNNKNNSSNVERFGSCEEEREQSLEDPLISKSSGLCGCGTRTPRIVETADIHKIRPARPDWYEELFAKVMNYGMKSYEAEMEAYKSQLFENLKGQAKEVVEIGIGAGLNLKYYAGETDMHVYGIDPNTKMEKYARGAAEVAGLSPANFEFIHGVGEVLPLSDASVDVVIGTLVMCSVKDIDRTLEEIKRVLKPGGQYIFIEHVAAKDGSFLKMVQNILNPIQKLIGDNCHLTRQTEKQIGDAGFSDVDTNMVVISKAWHVNPHVYGIARK